MKSAVSPTSSPGKRNADKAFTGFLMKATKGQANPQVALKLLAQELAKVERRVIDKQPAERLVFSLQGIQKTPTNRLVRSF